MLIRSDIFECVAPNRTQCVNPYKVYEYNNKIIIIATEDDSNTGMSLTNNCEGFWRDILKFLKYDIKNVIMIEHYDNLAYNSEDTFDIVTLNPTNWQRISKSELNKLINFVPEESNRIEKILE